MSDGPHYEDISDARARFGRGRSYRYDPRDKDHPMQRAIGYSYEGSRYWYDNAYWGDQGSNPWCVDYSWEHFWTGSPLTHGAPCMPHGDLYHQAQLVDEWAGEAYDGTSVRAGAKVLQSRGFIREYVWAWDIDTLAQALLTKGPVVMGTNWYDSMFFPRRMKDAQGDYRQMITIDADSSMAGGHAYLLNGVSTTRRTFRLKNSWGRSWGVEGRVSVSFETMARLLIEDGEACLALE